MVSTSETSEARPVWLVGASYGGTDDQSETFSREGIWQGGHADRYINEVKPIQTGNRIAIKATLVKKHHLPFDNRGHTVSVMSIKAAGTVTESAGNGRHLKINWTPVKPRREWFIYIYRGTVWRVHPGGWRNNGLITFVLEGEDQQVDLFRNAINGRTDSATSPKPIPAMLGRTAYSKFADRLLTYRSDRWPRVAAIRRFPAPSPDPSPCSTP